MAIEPGITRPTRVLVMCTNNATLSPMAAGWLNYLSAGAYEVASAGVVPTGQVHPLAVEAMAEVGIDISAHRPASFTSHLFRSFDFLVTMSSSLRDSEPSIHYEVERIHWEVDYPVPVTGQADSLAPFRSAREHVRRLAADFVLSDPIAVFALLGDRVRFRLLEELGEGDARTLALARRLGEPEDLIARELARLRDLGLVGSRPSDATRDIYYSLRIDRLREALGGAVSILHPTLAPEGPPRGGRRESLPGPTRVLFLCTHNSARSQIAEGLARHFGKGLVEAFSAGTEPSELHPLAARAAADMGIDISRQHPKSLDVYLGQHFDYIITVCDRAKEACPIFPGDPRQVHWSLPNPAGVEGTEVERFRAFQQIASDLRNRILLIIALIERDRHSARKPTRSRITAS